MEQYFIEDYKRLKEKNEALTEELHRYEANAGNHEYGITDLHQRRKAVKGSVIDDYYVKSRIAGGYLKVDEVREWLGLPDDELFEKTNGKMVDYTRILDFEEHEFQYTLMVKESRVEWVAVSDGKVNSSLIKIDDGEFCEGTWFGVEREAEFKAWLLGCLRDELEEGLERYEAEQAEKGGE